MDRAQLSLIALQGVREQRSVVLAFSPAPIQVNFLAWVSTSGGSFMHYLLSDPTASPPELRHLYSERGSWDPSRLLL